MKKYFKAFSAQETLVVGAIVLVIGVLVIFMMIKGSQVREAVTQLDKTYVALNNAFNLAKMNEGTPEAWVSRGDDYQKVYYKIFAKYLSIMPEELPSHLSGQIYYGIDGKTEEYVDKKEITMGRLNDGIVLRFANINPYCTSKHGNTFALRNVCGEIYVQIKDVNGNVTLTNSILGKNTFAFYLTKEGVTPIGTKGSKEDAQYLCRKKSDVAINSKSCTAWVLVRKNLDYLNRNIEW